MSDTDAYVAPAEDLPVIVEPENDLLTGKPKQGANELEDNEVPIDRTSSSNQNKNDQESDAAYNDLQDEFLVDEIIIVEEVPDDLEDFSDELSADDFQDDASGNSGNINEGKAAQEDTTKKDNSNPCGCKKQG